ncbi:MAG: hypothetical protein EBZ36_02090 [Acidobacteria bacterium]|nr:hypothetical protein [Acidobacteriota bacterium]
MEGVSNRALQRQSGFNLAGFHQRSRHNLRTQPSGGIYRQVTESPDRIRSARSNQERPIES